MKNKYPNYKIGDFVKGMGFNRQIIEVIENYGDKKYNTGYGYKTYKIDGYLLEPFSRECSRRVMLQFAGYYPKGREWNKK